jgi:hypothetical protein
MSFLVSPGIATSEIDLTAGASAVSVSDAAFVGPFQWGPAATVLSVDSEDVLVRTFGKPDDVTAPFWFTAQSFLAYSNLLRVCRVLATAALNATGAAKSLTGTVSATAPTPTFTGAGGFTTAGLQPGQTLVIGSTTYVINAITNSTVFTPSGQENSVTRSASAPAQARTRSRAAHQAHSPSPPAATPPRVQRRRSQRN